MSIREAFLFVGILVYTKDALTTESCFECELLLNCTIHRRSNSTCLVTCDENSINNDTCPESKAKPEHICLARLFLNKKNGTHIYTYHPDFLSRTSVVTNEYCPTTAVNASGSSCDEVTGFTHNCICLADNCNRLENITLALMPPSLTLSSSLSEINTNTVSNTTSSTTITDDSSILSSPPSPVSNVSSSTTTTDDSSVLSPNTSPPSPVSNVSSSTTTTDDSSVLIFSSVPAASATITTEQNQKQDDNSEIFIVISTLVFVVLVIFSMLVVTLCFVYSKHISKRSQHSMHIHTPPPLYNVADYSESSPFSITILHTIGYGKFGSVFKAIYDGYPVAVKVFSSHHYNSWSNEKSIYMSPSTPHENILRFIGCEQRGVGPRRQLYMMTEYHALGSLSRFLQHNKLNWSQVLRIVHSVSSGLTHLHSHNHVDGKGIKSAIAHRDVKSANVLVKDSSGYCVLGDLGLALILDLDWDDRQMANSGQVGTYRYMAPEALDARVNLRDIESFKQIDVYALALVIWEVCTRCELSDDLTVPPYQSPYFNLVGERPTLELMKRTVVIEKSRPDILGIWESHPGLKHITNIMEESWDEDPEARLTAANIVSRLENLERTQRKQEIAKEVDSTPPSHNITYTGEPPHAHRKVRVSSSFSGQPHNLPVAQRTRRSVGSTESPHNLMQSFQRHYGRGSLPRHFELTESSLSAKGPCTVEDNVQTDESTLQQLYSHDNETSMNVDAATGQHNATALTSSDASTTDSNTSLHSDNDQ